jgi:hypothetical protein
MSEVTTIYRFGDDEIEAPASMSIDEVRETWAQSHPAIEDAEEVVDEDGTVTFVQRGGTKG